MKMEVIMKKSLIPLIRMSIVAASLIVIATPSTHAGLWSKVAKTTAAVVATPVIVHLALSAHNLVNENQIGARIRVGSFQVNMGAAKPLSQETIARKAERTAAEAKENSKK